MVKRLPLLFAFCTALAGCGGGGSSATAPLPRSPAATGSTAQSVAISFRIPAPVTATASASARRPRYVSTNTGSASVSVNGAPAVTSNLAAGSLNCKPATGTGRTCTMTVNAPVGTDTFAVTLYGSTDGSGAVLSQNTISAVITAGIANTVTIALDGVVASITLTLVNATPYIGTPATTGLTVNLLDASGAAIIGSSPFANPITLTDSDTSGATSLSKTTLNTPADASGVTVAYTGAALAQAVFGAAASGVTAGQITTATLKPAAAPAGSNALVDWPTYAYDTERTGFNPSTTGITPASISSIRVAWQAFVGPAAAQPIIATNVAGHAALVIVAGFTTVTAFDATSGAQVWQKTVGGQNLQNCGTLGISGTLVYDAGLGAVFVAGGNNAVSPNHVILYRLNVANGQIQNQVDVTPTLVPGEATASHTALTLANGRLYLGTGSSCEGTTTGLPSWRGRVVSVDPGSMTLLSTFFTTYGQAAGNVGGGGVWAWGGVSADANGNIYAATGNAESNNTISQTPQPPFVAVADETVAYGDHLVKLPKDLSSVTDSNYPGFNFFIGISDLDYAGTPVIYQPPLGSGCGLLSATQGKGGTLVINDTQHMTPALNTFNFSVPSGKANYVGNPAYSPLTGYLYAAITSAGNGSSLLPPGLAAISGCGSAIAWNVGFGPDSAAYTGGSHPRSAPTVTAGGVVFIGTPCTSDGNGGCGAPGKVNGALWAVDASKGAVLGGGKPVLITGDHIRMAPSADGLWLWVMDNSGNVYALTVDPSVKAATAKLGTRSTPTFRIGDK